MPPHPVNNNKDDNLTLVIHKKEDMRLEQTPIPAIKDDGKIVNNSF